MAHVITQNCCNDTSCVDVCPVDAIHPRPDEPEYRGTDMLYIDPRTCIDCGACATACPVSAVFAEDDLPQRLGEYLEVNAGYFDGRPPAPPAPANGAQFTVPATTDRLRVAVVGSGPAGAYAATELLARRDVTVEVDLYDRLLTPWGLVRAGVAPDHMATREVAGQFEKITRHPRFRFRLGVGIGTDLPVQELAAHYHAVIYAVGAGADRPLGIPGEDLPGSHSATAFAAWYNGHPEHADTPVDLSGRRAVIIGNGNVALDVARILLTDPGELAATDIAPHAMEALRRSRIEEVVVLGRRGPENAAFTGPELRALAHVPGVSIGVDGVTDPATLPGPLAKMSSRPGGDGRRLTFRFHAAPQEILGDAGVTGVRVAATAPVAETAADDIAASLVLRATGHRGEPVPGLPFDEAAGRFFTRDGRVLTAADGAPVPGAYATGWIKRGPTGTIGTNRICAAETVAGLLADHADRLLPADPAPVDRLDAALSGRGVTPLGVDAWRRIDSHEKAQARMTDRRRA